MKKVREMQKLLVIGNGMVGHHMVEQLLQHDAGLAITVIGAEVRPAYDRVHLSEYFAGRGAEDLALVTEEEYRRRGVETVYGDAVVSINRQDKNVTTASGAVFDYDQLVLATGSYPFVPPIPGYESSHSFVYRTIEDLEEITQAAKGASVGTVIGGGLLGLEAANALRNLGLKTHVIEFAPGLMNVQLDASGSQMLKQQIEGLGIDIHVSTATETIVETDGEEHRLRLVFSDGSSLATDVLVFSAGIRPHDALASDAGLALGQRGGITIDSQCRSCDPSIYAIGECAAYEDRIYGLVAPGYRQAETAAASIVGAQASFEGADMSTKLKLLGIDVGSIGDAQGLTPGALSFSFTDEVKQIYKHLLISPDGKRLLGAVLVGDCSNYDSLLQYYLNDIALPDAPENLILPQGSGEPPLSGAELPAQATICSCLNVDKASVISAIEAGCISVSDVKSQTAASTGCGGCSALLKTVVDSELEARGIEVSKAICEHFDYTRQELFHLCKVKSVHSFEELITQYGTGHGCVVCKPAVASILASLWNDHIHEPGLVGLQDTNDTFMANMQKNGSYSVVPRIAGGEISPDKLIVIGEVAKKYSLYTKITGGQRIDLFGAQLHQLPQIWGELIDAGFETGHAYGKSLRTVKSCVGSTWCRYGVQDSVSMALHIENRYKGLRSPHKLKSAVSGCTRECAEAQSKDFGVIATERGWNLYLGGNGGMKPRHADLFATDLDAQTLLRTIDRYLMFYVQTAERLQRTSVWLENLEGGIDYLRDVIVEDSLGICTELDEQMAQVVGTYQCEWKTALNDPEKLKRFRTFVNCGNDDPSIVFVEEREQRKPAPLLIDCADISGEVA